MDYTSCIRIRGVPILPPLLTEESRTEMIYYKQLALGVEERLARQRLTPENSPDTLKSFSTPRISRKSSKCGSKTEETLSDDETTLTKSTDLNKYLANASDSDTSSEPSKPRVPTSLDIVPITVEPLKKSKSSSSLQHSGDEPRKLVRQGSYTLDTPSPLLLAHLEHNRPDYVPTSMSESHKMQKRREWNLNEAKNVWKIQNTGKIDDKSTKNQKTRMNGSLESINTKSFRENTGKVRRAVLERSKSSHEVKNRFYEEKSQCSVEKQRNIKRAQSFDKGKDLKVSGNQFQLQNRNPSVNQMKGDSKCKNLEFSKNPQNSNENLPENSEKHSENLDNSSNTKTFTINEKMDKKLSGSMGDLENSVVQSQPKEIDERMTRSLDTNDFEMQKDSERLLGVFRDIQRTHERQMADLIERQRKEQAFLQQAFEKQQLMLLEQIDKAFPGISIMDLVKRVTEKKKKGEWKNDDFSSSFDSDESISINFGESAVEEASPEGRGQRQGVNRQLFPLEGQSKRMPVTNGRFYDEKHIKAATTINAYARGFLVRRMMKTERIVSLKNTYKEALHCMLKLTIDAPLELPELNFHRRLQLQCDAASMNIVELFTQSPAKQMEIIAHDRQIKKAKMERPNSARSSISFATQRTLARKKLKELGIFQLPDSSQGTSRTRCMSWTSNNRDKKSPGIVYRGIKRSTSAGAVRKPWR